jgi:glycosyltransferase involved in cell wall biosynthesis
MSNRLVPEAAGGDRSVCVVVPCYNEQHRLQVESFRRWVAASRDTRILFVDDGSKDRTLDVLASIQAAFPDRITVLDSKPNRGKAYAVRTGILHALDELAPAVVGYWDADLATPLDSVECFLSVLATRPDIEMVFGSRVKLLGRRVERRPQRHYLGRIFATAVSIVLRLPIYDSQCGAKLFRVKPHTRSIFSEPFLSKWVFDVEIIARYMRAFNGDIGRLEAAIYEYPLEAWLDVAGSKVRPLDFVIALNDLLRIRARYR